jgi:membrane protein involved in colicin uptake
MPDEKKYEILPGVDIPDMKTIKDAASDYSASGVEDFEIKSFAISKPVAGAVAPVSTDELSDLQNMGDKVAADEERQAAESRKRMDSIMKNAVQAPSDLNKLRRENANKMNEEDRKKMEEQIAEEEKAQAEIDAKNKAREDRRKLQQQLLEEARERARIDREQEKYLAEKKKEEERAAAAAEAVAENADDSAKKEEAKPEVKPEVKADEKSIATDDETFDDFSEFLGEGSNPED